MPPGSQRGRRTASGDRPILWLGSRRASIVARAIVSGVSSPLASVAPRRAELLASLSLAADLGMGQPLEHGLRSCLLATRLGEAAGLGARELNDVFHVSLLRWIGCTANSHEVAASLGDDLGARTEMALLDVTQPEAVAAFIRRHSASPAGALPLRSADWPTLATAHCETADQLAGWLDLGATVRRALGQVFERWDGGGLPHGLAGEHIEIAARLTRLAGDLEMLQRTAGPDFALRAIASRASSVYDPFLAQVSRRHGEGLLAEIARVRAWPAVLESEPAGAERVDGDRLDRALLAMADFADLKSPWFTGHSRAVADLAAAAGAALGLPTSDQSTLRAAGLVQDLGRVGISNATWERPGPLDDREWESVRLHPYLTERTLIRSPFLSSLVETACAHHERLDGSGYHRRVDARTLPLTARVLAAADAYQAMREDRPHRPALSADAAAAELDRAVARRQLDPDAVRGILVAAGRAPGRRRGPAQLTPREIDVITLLGRGLTNRGIAERLVISTKTVSRHLEHVYTKLGVSTRGSATLVAMQYGLLPGEASSPAGPAGRRSG